MKNLLPHNTVDIWEIPLPACDLNALALNDLSPDEQTRFQRFYFAKHKRRFAQSRIALRTILSHYLHQCPADLEFAYSAFGKPSLPHFHNLQFNLSHSKDLALLAVCQTHPIGIDIEFFSERPFLGIASHLFSFQEQQQLACLPPSLIPLAFFSTWAQKEAIMKAVGMGMSYPTKAIDLRLLPIMPYLVYEPQTQQDLKIMPFLPRPAACAAICYHPDLTEIRYFKYDSTVQLKDLICLQTLPNASFSARDR